MLISKLLLVLATIVATIAGRFDVVTTLPMVNGVDIDAFLVQGMGQFYAFSAVIWPVRDVLYGAIVLWSFHGLMMLLRLLIGHRAPQNIA